MKNGSIMSCHLTMLSEKIEESLGNPLFPHSHVSLSPLPLLFFFFPFFLLSFFSWSIALFRSISPMDTLATNEVPVDWIAIFYSLLYFILSFHTFCNHLRFFYLVSFVPTCLFHVVVVVLPPPLWRSCIAGPCSSGAGEAHHPSWRCYSLPALFWRLDT